MSIILPLYIYPLPGNWNPIYWAAGNNTHLNFTCILNPCSGPCLTTAPSPYYTGSIPILKSYPNIRTLGYVATNYTNKPIDDVLEEIRRYANWTAIMGSPDVGVDGVFFDETPGTYDWQKWEYLRQASEEVRKSQGLGERIVVHNPGTIPPTLSNYLPLANITVVYEETFTHWLDSTILDRLTALPPATGLPKSAFGIMLHSVPNLPEDLLEWTVRRLREMAEWNYLSSVSVQGEYWHSFSQLFGPFVKVTSEEAGWGDEGANGNSIAISRIRETDEEVLEKLRALKSAEESEESEEV